MLFRTNSWKIKKSKYTIVILLSVLYGMSTMAEVTASSATQPGHSLPHTRKLSEIDLIYYQDFPYFESHHYQPTPECVLLREKTKRQGRKPHLLRCTEHINLLLPTTQAENWNKEQKQQGYVNLHTKQLTAEYVNPTVHAHIILIKPVTVITEKISHGTSGYPATVLYTRHAQNVKTYRFKNLQTGVISTINATDNHPFYSADKQTFIPIASAADSDRMITETGQSVRLICAKKSKKHCGIPDKNNQLTTVYNLETYPKHTYFAGKNNILVHNCSYSEDSPDHIKPFNSNEKMITDPITNKQLPKKHAMQLVVSEEEPEREQAQQVEDGIWYSIAGARTLKADTQKTHLISPDTQSKITHIRDFSGHEFPVNRAFFTIRPIGKHPIQRERLFPQVNPPQRTTYRIQPQEAREAPDNLSGLYRALNLVINGFRDVDRF